MSPLSLKTDETTRSARAVRASYAAFALNGLLFATWVSRIPQVRTDLGLSNSELGLLLLALAGGSVLAMPLTGAVIQRWGTAAVVRAGAGMALLGFVLVTAGIGIWNVPVVVGLGLFCYGIGTGSWDVAMNVEGAVVERGLGRSLMPRLHAVFSLGTVAGGLAGAGLVRGGVEMPWHLLPVAAGCFVGCLWLTRHYVVGVAGSSAGASDESSGGTSGSAFRAWLDPRTLLIGVMVLSLALAEGTANDWLAVALVDGYGVEEWVGVAGFSLFVGAMTLGRFFGGGLLDRWGRLPVLWATMACAAGGVLMIAFGGTAVVVVLGILLWGLGASLGFPVGISAAADDPEHAAVRVSVVSTIGYGAFLVGPPLLGFVGDQVGTLYALLAVAFVMVPSALVVPAARPLK